MEAAGGQLRTDVCYLLLSDNVAHLWMGYWTDAQVDAPTLTLWSNVVHRCETMGRFNVVHRCGTMGRLNVVHRCRTMGRPLIG